MKPRILLMLLCCAAFVHAEDPKTILFIAGKPSHGWGEHEFHDGCKVLDESLRSIRTKFDPRSVLVEPLDPETDPGVLRAIPGVKDLSKSNGTYEVQLNEGVDVAGAMREIVGAVAVARVELHRPTLEDVFVQIVTGSRQPSEQLRAALQAEPQATEQGA